MDRFPHAPFCHIFGFGLSWRDIILLGGGSRRRRRSTPRTEGEPGGTTKAAATATVGVIVTQIAFIDIIFSLDSVITAVGMADHLWVMVAAIVIAMVVMLLAADPLAEFVSRHPTVKMLALSFLLLIGTVLIADGLHFHIPKGLRVQRTRLHQLIVESLNFRRAHAGQLRRRSHRVAI
mgnify:CR=1 FL=1